MNTRSGGRKASVGIKSTRPKKQSKMDNNYWEVYTWDDMEEIPNSKRVFVKFNIADDKDDMDPFHNYLSYKGGWKNGMPHGNGIIVYKRAGLFKQTSEYKGQIRNGFAHGDGVLTRGRFSWQGKWRNGERHGKFRTETDTNIYEGEYQNGEKHGLGKLTRLTDNTSIIARWEKGNQKDVYGVQNANMTYFGPLTSDNKPSGKGIVIDEGTIYFGAPFGGNAPTCGYYIENDNIHLYDDTADEDIIVFNIKSNHFN